MNAISTSRFTIRSLLFLLVTACLAAPAMASDVSAYRLEPSMVERATIEPSTFGPSTLDAAGDPANGPGEDGLHDNGGNRDGILRTGMTVLGSWAVGNIASGLTGMAIADDPANRGFWEMNAMWNTVNLGIAAWSLYDLWRSPSDMMDLGEYREESHSLEKVLLFNAGLNVAYMAVGGWMWDRGARGEGLAAGDISSERLTGWGQSMVMQGAFLLAFDLTMARIVAGDRSRTAP